MSYKIIWSAFVEQQLDAIYEYYRINASEQTASKIIKTILLKPDGLTECPYLGAAEELLADRATHYRYLITSNYKIIYSVDEANRLIKIADVFDTRQNPVKISRGK